MIILFNVIVFWECVCVCVCRNICDIRHIGFTSVMPLQDLWFLFSIVDSCCQKKDFYTGMLNQLLNLYPLFVKYEELMKKMCQVLIAHDFMTKYILSFQMEPTKNIKRGRKWIQNGRNLFWIMEFMCNS